MLEVVIALFRKPHTRLHPPLLSPTLGFVYTLNCLGVDHQDSAFLSCLPPLAGGLVGLQSQEELSTCVDFCFLLVEIREDFGGQSCFNLNLAPQQIT